MNKEIRVGFIGCGGICGPHLRAMRNHTQERVAVFCDSNEQRAVTRAGEYGIGTPEIMTDYKELLQREDIDVVHILTPHNLHAHMIREALAAGKHVLCEKPLATSKADARALIGIENSTRLGMVFQNRYNKATRECLRIIKSEELGKLVGLKAEVCWKRDKNYYSDGEWRGRWETEGGGCLINQAIHTIDLLYYFCGPFAAVKGSISRELNAEFIEVEDNAHAVFRFRNGCTGLLHASNNYVEDFPPVIALCLEKGNLEMRGNSLWRTDGGRMEELVKPVSINNGAKAVYGSGHELLLEEYYRNLRENTPFWLDAKEAYPSVWAVRSIYESALSGRWVSFV